MERRPRGKKPPANSQPDARRTEEAMIGVESASSVVSAVGIEPTTL